MRTLLRIKFGSHLYGTSTPDSDLDFKSVFAKDARADGLRRQAAAKREKQKAGRNKTDG